jgi:flagellar basal-body rod protein FlgG
MQLPEGEDSANYPIEQRIVKFSGAKGGALNDLGEIMDGEQKLGQLSVVNVKNQESLHKIGNNNFSFKPNITPELESVKTPSLKQGFLETSNVNVIQEMTDMIMAQRIFEGTQKAISTFDSMADKLINQVGNTKG